MNTLKGNWVLCAAMLLLTACSTSKRIGSLANKSLLHHNALAGAHTGIAIYDAGSSKYLYTHQSNKYFTPASNIKLFTLFAAQQHLHDSIIGARYQLIGDEIVVYATGDPTFLHPDFAHQPLLSLLQHPAIKEVTINTPFASEAFGRGWSWSDYTEPYMAERDPMPMYGNVATFAITGDSLQTVPGAVKDITVGNLPKYKGWKVTRKLGGHFFEIDTATGPVEKQISLTLAMDKGAFAAHYLADTLHKVVTGDRQLPDTNQTKTIYTQPADSLYKLMMHRSDNFFAEQTLLMVANQKLGIMNDKAVIDTLLTTQFANMPQPPQWVDGSGLSRYNLCTPQDLVWLLQQLQQHMGMPRLQVILPGANEGTLSGWYKGYEGSIWAKTGTLSNNVALSGYLITKRNKQLIFSILINNHTTRAANARGAIERFLTGLIDTL